jgi:hypothetical protein
MKILIDECLPAGLKVRLNASHKIESDEEFGASDARVCPSLALGPA